MKLTVNQLKKLIKEETKRVVTPPADACEATAHAIESTLVEYFGDWGGKSSNDLYLEALALCEDYDTKLDSVFLRGNDLAWQRIVMHIIREMLGPKLAELIKFDILSSRAAEYMQQG
jgi:hypothetical protein